MRKSVIYINSPENVQAACGGGNQFKIMANGLIPRRGKLNYVKSFYCRVVRTA